jgi:RND family efflux transporter MFP subunit
MNFKNLLKIVLPLLVLALAVVGAKKLMESRTPPPQKPRVHLGPLVKVVAATPEDAAVKVKAFGTVRPKNQVAITPQVAGKVVELSPSLKSGGFLKEGELVLRVDARDYELAVEKARAEVAKAQYELARAEEEATIARREWELMGQHDRGGRDGGSRELPGDESLVFHGPQLKLARTGVAAAQARLDEAELALSRTWIVAPFQARVLDESVDLGQYVTVGKSVATLYATDAAEIAFSVRDEELAWLGDFAQTLHAGKAGAKVDVRADYAGQATVWPGRVVRTEGAVDAASRTINLVVEVADPYKSGRAPLVVGSFVEGEIRGKTLSGVFALPRHALSNDDGGNGDVTVWVVEGDQLRLHPVEVARIDGTVAYVSAGLGEGDRVVVSRIDAATEGMKVRVAEGE